ncbi:hypothetical protein CDAR_177681 [Caerostris darwini]|uniref:Uncharacterized protein n=1 Tax=Caerostris darwini TaxID=1538125 RepID=A0AAV4TYH6_9ARAC|nr:hypothetical protein CDAR_177681 [Caerostris darwini]
MTCSRHHFPLFAEYHHVLCKISYTKFLPLLSKKKAKVEKKSPFLNLLLKLFLVHHGLKETHRKKPRNSVPKSTAKEFRKVEQFTFRTKLPANRRPDKEQGEIGVGGIDRQKKKKKSLL